MKKFVYILILLQILDGICTYIGVIHYGPEAEGNPIIKYIIKEIGLLYALFLLKGLACSLILILFKRKTKMSLIILKILIIVYLNVVMLWFYSFYNNWSTLWT